MKIPDNTKKKKRTLLVASSVLVAVIIFILLYAQFVIPPIPFPIPEEEREIDRFDTLQIYPTVPGGREWFISMQDPFYNELVSFNSAISLDKQLDGSWRVNSSKMRMRVDTSLGQEEWKNVEMTGYVKMISPIIPTDSNELSDQDEGSEDEDSLDPHLTWRARGGWHNDEVPCEGTALNGGLYFDGKVSWKKEIWHTGGYTAARGVSEIPISLVNKWIGWKTVMYNLESDSSVKMESYLDIDANNKWRKVSEVEDDGKWFADTSDEEFYSIDCGKEKDHIITNSGPIATFRADNLIFDFKNFSIREIIPP
ncbi:MAG TPA: hypothetical protein VE130_15065 [Nitrososphaeraceae archaeon]|jgi:hypothetical protein|nr:hypothetical protein [Nitrososphaeraceae archaeon]